MMDVVDRDFSISHCESAFETAPLQPSLEKNLQLRSDVGLVDELQMGQDGSATRSCHPASEDSLDGKAR